MIDRFLYSLAFLALLLVAAPGFAQDDDPPPVEEPSGGVEIDAKGVFRSRALFDNSGRLDRERMKAADRALNADIKKSSKFRKVSLNRLEAEAAKLIAEGKPLPPEMQYLAGLTRITHVFYFEETKDIVIAGPAEGFYLNGGDRVVGMKSGSPVLHLEDMVVALRSYGPEGKSPRVISCSIDPTQKGLVNLKNAYAHAQRNFRGGDEAEVVNYFRNALGMQTITVKGVSPRTRFAQVMVDADYHMKLIGIGLERPPVRITNFIDKASPTSVAKNSLQRWYFKPDYECVRVSRDETAMTFEGGGVELVGEDEKVAAGGNRTRTGRMNRASQGYCRSFTKMYDALAKKAPLYAELRNVIDMSVAAAFIQEMDFYKEAGWELKTFGDESKYRVERYAAPTQVEPCINAVWKGSFFMTPIGGGVNIQPRAALSPNRMQVDDSGKIDGAKKDVKTDKLTEGQWWWD